MRRIIHLHVAELLGGAENATRVRYYASAEPAGADLGWEGPVSDDTGPWVMQIKPAGSAYRGDPTVWMSMRIVKMTYLPGVGNWKFEAEGLHAVASWVTRDPSGFNIGATVTATLERVR